MNATELIKVKVIETEIIEKISMLFRLKSIFSESLLITGKNKMHFVPIVNGKPIVTGCVAQLMMP